MESPEWLTASGGIGIDKGCVQRCAVSDVAENSERSPGKSPLDLLIRSLINREQRTASCVAQVKLLISETVRRSLDAARSGIHDLGRSR